MKFTFPIPIQKDKVFTVMVTKERFYYYQKALLSGVFILFIS